MMNVNCDFISIAANSVHSGILWESNSKISFLAFSASNVIAIVDAESQVLES